MRSPQSLLQSDGFPIVGSRTPGKVRFDLTGDFVTGKFAIIAGDYLFAVTITFDLEGDFIVFEFASVDVSVATAAAHDLAANSLAFLFQLESGLRPGSAESAESAVPETRVPFPSPLGPRHPAGVPIIAALFAIPIRDDFSFDRIAAEL